MLLFALHSERDTNGQVIGWPLTWPNPPHIRFRCEVPATMIIRPHILKHRIPELPNETKAVR